MVNPIYDSKDNSQLLELIGNKNYQKVHLLCLQRLKLS